MPIHLVLLDHEFMHNYIKVISSEISVLITYSACRMRYRLAFASLPPKAKPNIVLDHVMPAYEISRHYAFLFTYRMCSGLPHTYIYHYIHLYIHMYSYIYV